MKHGLILIMEEGVIIMQIPNVKGIKLVLDYVANGLDVFIINFGSKIGPFDHTLQFGRLFIDFRDKKVPGIPPGGAP